MNVPLFKVRMPSSIDGPLLETLHSGFIGQGSKVEQFERELADELGTPRVLTVNSGTSAIHLALRLAGVGQGHTVICSPMTCTASNMPVLERGAKIVWADINPHDGNIDPESVARLITRKTKAIICVDWGGYPCDLDRLLGLSEAHGISLIEDAAHALGAMYKGARVGSVSPFTTFSFQAIKHLTCVDGGALTCQDPRDYRRGKLLRWYGIDRETPRKDARCEDDIAEYGYKFHMNDVAATIGIEGLKGLRECLEAHRANAFYYNCEIADRGLRHVKPLDYRDDRISSHWLYTVLVDDRPSFVEWMVSHGVNVSRVHARNDKHTCFRDAGNRDHLPGVDEFDAHQVSIPVGWWVTQDEREAIMDVIGAWDRVCR
jgi:dTDP-4-amino-4,6-dideoxygalactose transaminase